MKKMKVWSLVVFRHQHPYGTLAHGQVRAVVAAKNRAAAARAFKVQDRELKNYGSETGNDDAIAVAMSKPGTVFITSLNYPTQPYIEDK
jgi:hypothetical protein